MALTSFANNGAVPLWYWLNNNGIASATVDNNAVDAFNQNIDRRAPYLVGAGGLAAVQLALTGGAELGAGTRILSLLGSGASAIGRLGMGLFNVANTSARGLTTVITDLCLAEQGWGAGTGLLGSGAAGIGYKAISELEATGGNVVRAVEQIEKIAPAENSFFQGTQYTQKVVTQMRGGIGEFHSFAESVTAFESGGSISNVTGGDGVVRQMLEIPGSYNGRDGVFQFIKEANGMINHRLFVPRTVPVTP